MHSRKAKQLIISSLLTATIGFFLVSQQSAVIVEAVDADTVVDQNGGGLPSQDFPSVGNYLPSNPPASEADTSDQATDTTPGYFPPAPNYSGGYYGGGIVAAGDTSEASDDDASSSSDEEDNDSTNGLKTPTNQESINVASNKDTQKLISSFITPGKLISLAGVLMMLMTLILLVSRFLKKNNEKINSLIENDTKQTKSLIDDQALMIDGKKPKKNKAKSKQKKNTKKQAGRDKAIEMNALETENQPAELKEVVDEVEIPAESQLADDFPIAQSVTELPNNIDGNHIDDQNIALVVKESIAQENDNQTKQSTVPTPPSFKTGKTVDKKADKNDSTSVSFVQKYNLVSKHPEVIAAEKKVIDSTDPQTRIEEQHRFVEKVNQLYKANNSDLSETESSNSKKVLNTTENNLTNSPEVVEAKPKKTGTKPVIIKRSKSTTNPVNKKVN